MHFKFQMQLMESQPKYDWLVSTRCVVLQVDWLMWENDERTTLNI